MAVVVVAQPLVTLTSVRQILGTTTHHNQYPTRTTMTSTAQLVTDQQQQGEEYDDAYSDFGGTATSCSYNGTMPTMHTTAYLPTRSSKLLKQQEQEQEQEQQQRHHQWWNLKDGTTVGGVGSGSGVDKSDKDDLISGSGGGHRHKEQQHVMANATNGVKEV